MVSYVLLISIAIIMAISIFSWLKLVANVKPIEGCEEGTSVLINSLSCTNETLILNLKNNGRFSVDGFVATVGDSKDKFPITPLAPIGSGGKVSNVKGYYIYPKKLKPGQIKEALFSKDSIDFDIKSMRIQPFIISNNDRIVCEDAVIREDVTCGVPSNSCYHVLQNNPTLDSESYNINLEGNGEIPVYCDMETDGGGWTLISVVRNNDPNQVIVDNNYCNSIDANTNCKGKMPINAVNDNTEILIKTLSTNDWIIIDNFVANGSSALNYFSLDKVLTYNTSCDPCSSPIDPDMRIAKTSGFNANHNSPLYQSFRWGGWRVGANPNNANYMGLMFASGYSTAHKINKREDAMNSSELQSNDHHAIYWRSK